MYKITNADGTLSRNQARRLVSYATIPKLVVLENNKYIVATNMVIKLDENTEDLFNYLEHSKEKEIVELAKDAECIITKGTKFRKKVFSYSGMKIVGRKIYRSMRAQEILAINNCKKIDIDTVYKYESIPELKSGLIEKTVRVNNAPVFLVDVGKELAKTYLNVIKEIAECGV